MSEAARLERAKRQREDLEALTGFAPAFADFFLRVEESSLVAWVDRGTLTAGTIGTDGCRHPSSEVEPMDLGDLFERTGHVVIRPE